MGVISSLDTGMCLKSQLYCEDCYGRFLAPDCQKCRKKIIGNCLKAMSTTFHPECFACAYCNKIFANSPFYLEDGLPYCEEDWKTFLQEPRSRLRSGERKR